MANITGNGSKGHHKFILEVNQTSQNVANNASTISFAFKIAPIETSWNWEMWGAYIKYTLNINGTVYSGNIDNYDGYSTITLKSGSQTVAHNSDGSKSISYSFSVTDSSGVNYTSGNASASGTLALTTIPRSSTVSCGGGDIGGTTVISITRASNTFTHTLKYAFGNLTGTIATGVGTSYTWTIPTTFYTQLATGNAGTGRITCETYSGTTLIGTTTTDFTARVTNSNPTFTASDLSYADTNSTVTAITGNSKHIVQNKSTLRLTYTPATAKNSATIKSYSFTLNGVTKTSTSAGGIIDFGVINSSSNLTLTGTVTDSRGNTTSASITVTVLPYTNPNALVTLERLNNYEDETYLKVDGTVASVNSKNSMSIQYRYKESGGSYGAFTTIFDNVQQVLSLDKNNAYIFNIVVTDKFGSKYDKEHVLGKGVFPLFIDTGKNSVGINDFPIEKEALRVAEGNINVRDTGTDVGYQQGGQMVLRNNGNGVTIVSGTSDSVLLRPKGSTDASVQFKINSAGVISVNEVAVVASGSNSNGKYVKFYDGTMLQWNYMEVTDQAISNEYGVLYIGLREITYPVAFVGDAPILTCSQFKYGTSASWGGITEHSTPLTKGNLRVYDVVSRTTGTNCKIGWFAIGRWK